MLPSCPTLSLPLACSHPRARRFLKRFERGVAKEQTIGLIKRLKLQGSLQVVLFHAPTPSLVVVSSESNAISQVRTEMQDSGTLFVYSDDRSWSHSGRHTVSASHGSIASAGDITIAHATHGAIAAGGNVIVDGERLSRGSSSDILIGIAMPLAPDVTLAGSGHITLFDVDQMGITLDLAGSGTITAYGKVDELNINLSGSGDVEAQELESTAASLAITGSGSISAKSTVSINARIIGSGDIELDGAPDQVHRSVVGSGSIDVR